MPVFDPNRNDPAQAPATASNPAPIDAPLQSTHASDPAMAELIAFFVEEMADRVEVIRTAAEQNDLGKLRVVAHQLKGAGTGYGFEPISKSAAALEQSIDSVDHDGSIDDLSQQIDELIGLCRRASV